MIIRKMCGQFEKAFETNQTGNTTPSRAPQATLDKTTNPGLIELTSINGGAGPNTVTVMPYGVGADGSQFKLDVWGWRSLSHGNSRLEIPALVGSFSGNLSTPSGIAGKAIGATEVFADTVAKDIGAATIEVTSPANDKAAHIRIPNAGWQYLEFVASTEDSATSVNALVSQE